MGISESIYEVVVTPYYLKTARSESNRTGLISKNIWEAASSNTRPATDGSAVNCRKQYVYFSKSEFKTCMIHSIGHSSDECKVLGEFRTNYAASQTTKYRGRNPVPRKIFQKKQENHAIINNVGDEIQINEPKK